MRHFTRVIAVLGLAAVVSACSTVFPEKPGLKETELAEKIVKDASASTSSIERVYFREVPEIRVTGKTFRLVEKPDLPPVFDQTFIISPTGSVTFDEVAAYISRESGVQVEVLQDARVSFLQLPSKGGGKTEHYKIDFRKRGTLVEILDALVATGQVSWKYVGDRVLIHKLDSKTFTLDTLAGSEKFTSEAGTSINASQEGTRTTSNTKSTIDAEIPDIWESIVENVKTFMTKEGTMATNVQTGSLTVTDTPQVLAKIQEYVDGENERLRTTIMYRVDIIEVSRKTDDNYGVSLSDLIYGGSDGLFTLTTGVSDIGERASTLVGSVIKPSSRFNGSQAMIKALSGKTDLVSHRTAFTSEVVGLVARVQELRERGYVAERSVAALNTTAGLEVTQRIETTTEGFIVSMMGMLASNGGLILQTLVDISNIEDIERRGTDDNYVESPLRLVRNGKSRTHMQPGDTVIASLIEQNRKEKAKRGIGSPFNWLLGGESTSSNQQIYTLVLVTPYYKEY